MIEVLDDNTEIKESRENNTTEKKDLSTHDLSWDELSNLAKTVGSTIDREPINIEKEKRAFQRKMDTLD